MNEKLKEVFRGKVFNKVMMGESTKVVSFIKRTAALIHPFHDHQNHIPHFVATIPLTQKGCTQL